MKFKFQLLLLIPLLSLNSCWPLWEESSVLELTDFSQRSNTSVSIDLKERRYVYKISLKIVGEADGSFEINTLKFQSGKIDTVINNMDWYQSEYPIEFKPISSSKGKLKVKVTFFLME